MGTYSRVIVTRIATDMRHQHVNILALPAQPLGIYAPQVATVTVAVDSSQRAELVQAFRDLHRADVASMPYIVARLEIVQVFVVPIGVGSLMIPIFFIVFERLDKLDRLEMN